MQTQPWERNDFFGWDTSADHLGEKPYRGNFSLALQATSRILSDIMTDTPLPDSFGNSAAQDPFQAAKASAMKAAEELRAAASQKASELRSAAESKASHFKATAEQKADQYREYAGEAFSEAKGQYSDLKAEAEKTNDSDLKLALDENKVGEAEKTGLFALLAPMKDEIVEVKAKK